MLNFKNDDIVHIIDQIKKTNVKLQKRRYLPHYWSDKGKYCCWSYNHATKGTPILKFGLQSL